MGALNKMRDNRLEELAYDVAYIATELRAIHNLLKAADIHQPERYAELKAQEAELRRALAEAESRAGEWIARSQIKLPSAPDQSVRISSAPGHHLLRFAEFTYSKKVFKEILEPTIRDLREEYYEAVAEGRTWKARWVRVRGYWSFVTAAGLTSGVHLAKRLLNLWRLGG